MSEPAESVEVYYAAARELEALTGIPRFEWGCGAAMARLTDAHAGIKGIWLRTVDAVGGSEVRVEIVGSDGRKWHGQSRNAAFALMTASIRALDDLGPCGDPSKRASLAQATWQDEVRVSQWPESDDDE